MKQWEKNLNHIGKTELQQISVALIAAQSRSPFRHALGLGLTIVLSKLKNLFNWYKLKKKKKNIYIYIYMKIYIFLIKASGNKTKEMFFF